MDAARAPAQDEYSGSAVVGATLATFFFPLISLIVALLLMGRQRSERKRAQLRTWAWASVGWIAVELVLVVVFLVAFGTGSGSESGSLPAS